VGTAKLDCYSRPGSVLNIVLPGVSIESRVVGCFEIDRNSYPMGGPLTFLNKAGRDDSTLGRRDLARVANAMQVRPRPHYVNYPCGG
jgi:hypothetical protein